MLSMGNKYADKENHQNEGDVIYTSEKTDKATDPGTLYISESKPWNSVKVEKPGTLILNFTQSETSEGWVRQLFLKRSCRERIRVPKHLVSLDEKYLKRCLELMHANALKDSSSCALSVNPRCSSDMGSIMPEHVSISSCSLESSKHAFDHPMLEGPEGLYTTLAGEGIVGSIMGGNSMTNILRSPLFQRLGVSDHEATTLGEGTSLFENKRCVPPVNYLGSSPSRFSLSLAHNLRKETTGSDSGVQKSPISIPSSAPSSSPDSRGMIQCTWEYGIPCFAFSLDEQKGLYVAKVEVVANKGVEEYVYSFHAESDLVGKMRVSTSFSLCPNGSKLVERQFVLVGASENHAWETMHSSSTLNNKQTTRKLSKVMDVFKIGHTLKHRNPSIFCGTPGNFSAENYSEFTNSFNQQRIVKEVDFLPNLELAAIVVKDHSIQHEKTDKKEEVVGGWGLKFLKKAEIKQQNSTGCSECCASMDIIVPLGHHGGPRTKEAGPSSLIDRWRSGGQCDCGGWDVGCPIKVLKARPRGEEGGWSSSEESSPRDCKSFDVLTEGSKQGSPALKMVNIREDLYFINFRSSFMSPLQCFAIAVAIIHSRCPCLGPKHVH